MDSGLVQQKKTSNTQETECSEVCESLSELNDANIHEKHIDSVSCHPTGELIDSVLKDANSSEKLRSNGTQFFSFGGNANEHWWW